MAAEPVSTVINRLNRLFMQNCFDPKAQVSELESR